jgi:hypothetical protein
MKASVRVRQKYIRGYWYGDKSAVASTWAFASMQCVDYEYLAFISVQLGQVAYSEILHLYHQMNGTASRIGQIINALIPDLDGNIRGVVNFRRTPCLSAAFTCRAGLSLPETKLII